MNGSYRSYLLTGCWLAVCRVSLLLCIFPLAPVASSMCELPCRNNGICKSATRYNRNLASSLRDTDDLFYPRFVTESPSEQDHPTRLLFQQGPHCWCPAGFAGTLCEIEYTLCSSKDDTCFSGQPCQRAVDDFGTEFFHCGCDMSKSDISIPVASQFCERVSTVFCDTDSDSDAQKNLDPRQRSRGSFFCNNGGRCKDPEDNEEKGKRYLGCECQAGFSGSHCEISSYPVSPGPLSAYEELKAAAALTNPHRRLLLSLIVFLAILTCFFTAGYAFVAYIGQQQQKKNRKKRTSKTAEERARIPRTNYRGLSVPVPQGKQSYVPVHEIDMT